MAQDDPAAVIRLILEHSDGKKATPTQIAALMIPEVHSGENEFKRWWESAKKKLKGDGRFVIPAKKTDFVEMREDSVGQHEALLSRFNQARKLKDQLGVLDQISKSVEDFKADPAGLTAVLDEAGKSATRNQRLDIDSSFELLVTRDEIAGAAGLPASVTESPTLVDFMRSEESRLGEIIGNLPAAKQRFALFQMPTALGEDRWVNRALSPPAPDAQRPRGRRGRAVVRVQGARRGDAHLSGSFDPGLFGDVRDAPVALQGAWRREIQGFRQPAAVRGDPVGHRTRFAQRDQAQHQAGTTCFPATAN